MTQLERDIESLEYPGVDAKIVKDISLIHNLVLEADLTNKGFKIDDNLSIIAKTREVRALTFLQNFIKKTRGISFLPGTFVLYRYKRQATHYLEAHQKVRRFCTAIRIYKGTKCDCKLSFSIENTEKKKYYRPFDLFEFTSDFFRIDGKSTISSKKELNLIKKVYFKLGEAKVDDNMSYSKLWNAVKFFNHSYEEGWTLLKVNLAFTSLESLFSDATKSEVTYKIASRAAYFIFPKNSAKRKEIFTFIKRGYDIRSYFVHGSNVEKRVNSIMKQIEIEKGVAHYDFYTHFVNDLNSIVTKCLMISLLNKKYFDFLTKVKVLSDEESKFYDELVL